MRNIYLPIILVGILCGMLVQCNVATAEDMSIDMLNKKGKEKMLYSEDIARIDVGDTITWLPASKGHNVQFVSVPDGVEKVKSKLSAEFSYTFEKEGAYLYVCTPHATMGMIGVVLVGDSDVNLAEVKKHKFRGKSKKKFKQILKAL
jgi:pseudoazurin